MRKMKTRLMIAVVLLGLASALSAVSLYPTQMDRGVLKATSLPMTLGQWVGEDYPVDELTKQILETEDIVQRNYKHPEQADAVTLAVVYSPSNRRVAHPPEVCYKGSGWETDGKIVVEHAGLPPMVRLHVSKGAAMDDVVLYCYKAGERLTASYYGQQINILSNQLFMKSTASALLRFSTRIGDSESIDEAELRVVAFALEMMPEIREKLTE